MGLENLTDEQKADAHRKAAQARLPKDPFKVVPCGDFLRAGVSNEEVRAWLSSVPNHLRNLAISVVTGEATPTQVKKLKCLECNGFEDVPERVRNCQVWKCPMWLTRPYKTEEKE